MPPQESGLNEVKTTLLVIYMERKHLGILTCKTVYYNIVVKWHLQLHVQNENNNKYCIRILNEKYRCTCTHNLFNVQVKSIEIKPGDRSSYKSSVKPVL